MPLEAGRQASRQPLIDVMSFDFPCVNNAPAVATKKTEAYNACADGGMWQPHKPHLHRQSELHFHFHWQLFCIERSANICLKQASYKPQYIHLFSYKMLYWYMQCTHARSTCIQNIYLCLSATNPLVYFKFHEFFRNIFLKLFDIYFHTNCVCFSIDKSFVWHRFPCENALKHTDTHTRLCVRNSIVMLNW